MQPTFKRKLSDAVPSERLLKQNKTESRRYLPFPVELIIIIGEYLDDRSKAHLLSVAKKNIRKMGPEFWTYFEQQSSFKLVDLEHLPPKIRYFCQKKLLKFMVSVKEERLSLENAKSKIKQLPHLEKEHYGEEILDAQHVLNECVSWSVMTQSIGQSNLPTILQNISMRLLAGGTRSDALVAGWIAAHHAREIAKACFTEAFQNADGILETTLILSGFPSLYTNPERMKLAKQAAEKGFFESLEFELSLLNYSQHRFKELEKYPAAQAWKARKFLDHKNYQQAAILFDAALEGYRKLKPLNKAPIAVLEDAISTYTTIGNISKVVPLYPFLDAAYAEKGIPVPSSAFLNRARFYHFMGNYEETISLLKRWLETPSIKTPNDLHEAYYLLTLCFKDLKDFTAALKFGALCVAHGTSKSEELILIAELYFELKNFNFAIDLYQRALETCKEPDVLETLYWGIADVYKEQKLFHNYIEYLEKAYAVTEDWEAKDLLPLSLGKAYLEIKDEERACEWYSRASNIPWEHLPFYIKVQLKFSIHTALKACHTYVSYYIRENILLPDEMTLEIQPLLDAIDPNTLSIDTCIDLTNLYIALGKKQKVLALLDYLLHAAETRGQVPSESCMMDSQLFNLCKETKELEHILKYHQVVIHILEQRSKIPANFYVSAALLSQMLQDTALANRYVDLALQHNDGTSNWPSEFYRQAAFLKQHCGDPVGSNNLFLLALEQYKKWKLPPPGDIYRELATDVHGSLKDTLRYLSLSITPTTMPDVSFMEKIAKDCVSQGKIEEAIMFYPTIIEHHLAQHQSVPHQLINQVDELSKQAVQAALPAFKLPHFISAHAALGNEEQSLFFIKLALQNSTATTQHIEQAIVIAANKFFNFGKVKSITEISAIALQYPLSLACLTELGFINLRVQGPNLALQLFERSILSFEGCDEATKSRRYLGLGLAYAQTDEPAKAIDNCNLAKDHFNPKLYGPYQLMAIAKVYQEHGDPTQALKYYKYALESIGNTPPPQELIESVEKIAYEALPVEDRIVAGRILLTFKKGKAAIFLFKQILREENLAIADFHYFQANFYLAQAYEEQGKLQKALSCYLLAKTNPSYGATAIAIKLAMLFSKLQNEQEARKYFDEVLENFSSNLSAIPDSAVPYINKALGFTVTDQPLVIQEKSFFGDKRLAELTQYCNFFKEHLQLGWPGHHSVYRIKEWMDKQIKHLHLIHENNFEFLMHEALQLPQPEEVLNTLRAHT